MPLKESDSFFQSATDDEALETANHEFWRSLLSHMKVDCPVNDVHSILDVGCNRGGLLQSLAQYFRPEVLLGLEPLADARRLAKSRLDSFAPEVTILDANQWPEIPTGSVDLAAIHEVLYLVEDLPLFMKSLARVVRTDRWAFLVLGCHTENPLWARWKGQIRELGHEVFDHSPMDILCAAALAGFHTSVRPLRHDGWIIYNANNTSYIFDSVGQMLDHHYRHKLLFRLIRTEADPGE